MKECYKRRPEMRKKALLECEQEWDSEKNAPYTVEEVINHKISAGQYKRWWWKCRFCGREWKEAIHSKSWKTGRNRTSFGCKECRRKALEIVDVDTGKVYSDYSDAKEKLNLTVSAEVIRGWCCGMTLKPAYNLKYAYPEIHYEIYTAYKDLKVEYRISNLKKAVAEGELEWDAQRNSPYTIMDAMKKDRAGSWWWNCSICGTAWKEGVHVKLLKSGKNHTCLGCEECRRKSRMIINNDTGTIYVGYTEASSALGLGSGAIKARCEGAIVNPMHNVNVSYAYPDIRKIVVEGFNGQAPVSAEKNAEGISVSKDELRRLYMKTNALLKEVDIPGFGKAYAGMVPLELFDIRGKELSRSEYEDLCSGWDLSECSPLIVKRCPIIHMYRVEDGIRRISAALAMGEKQLPVIIYDTSTALSGEKLAAEIWNGYGINPPFEKMSEVFRCKLLEGIKDCEMRTEIRWILDVLVSSGWMDDEVQVPKHYISALKRIYAQTDADDRMTVRNILVECMSVLDIMSINRLATEKYPEFDKRVRDFYFLADTVSEKTGKAIVSKTMSKRVMRKSGPGNTYRDAIAEYMKEHPGATVSEIVKNMGLSEMTVRTHYKALSSRPDVDIRYNPTYTALDKFREKNPDLTLSQVADKLKLSGSLRKGYLDHAKRMLRKNKK